MNERQEKADELQAAQYKSIPSNLCIFVPNYLCNSRNTSFLTCRIQQHHSTSSFILSNTFICLYRFDVPTNLKHNYRPTVLQICGFTFNLKTLSNTAKMY